MLSDPVRGQSPVAGDVNPRMGGALDNDRGANAPCDETRNEPPRNTITRDVANRIYVFTFTLSPFTIYPIHHIHPPPSPHLPLSPFTVHLFHPLSPYTPPVSGTRRNAVCGPCRCSVRAAAASGARVKCILLETVSPVVFPPRRGWGHL